MVEFRLIRRCKDFDILGLIITDRVQIDGMIQVSRLERLAFVWFRIAGIEKADIFGHPYDIGKLGPLDRIRLDLARFHIKDLQRPPVRTAILNRISEQAAVTGRFPTGQRSSPVVRPCCRIDQHPFFAIHAVTDIEHRLILAPALAFVEIFAASFDRNAEIVVIE